MIFPGYKNIIFSQFHRRPNFTLELSYLRRFSTKIWTSVELSENHTFGNMKYHIAMVCTLFPYPKIVEPLRAGDAGRRGVRRRVTVSCPTWRQSYVRAGAGANRISSDRRPSLECPGLRQTDGKGNGGIASVTR